VAGFSNIKWKSLFRSSKSKSATTSKNSATEKSAQQQTQTNQQNVNTTQRRNDSVDFNQQHSIYGNHDASKSAPDLGERKYGSNSVYGNHDASKSAPDLGKQKYGSSFEERLNKRNSEGTFKSTPLDDKPRFGSKFEERLNQQQGKRTEARKADDEKTSARKERTEANRKAYEEKINTQQQAEAGKNSEGTPKPEPKKYQAYRPDNTYARQAEHDPNAEALRMPDPKDFQYKSYGGAYKQTDSTYGSSTSLNRDFDNSKSETGSLYSHSNGSRDSSFDEPINYGNSQSHSTQQKASNTTERQQQSLYQNKNDSAVSVSSHYGNSGSYKGQSSQSLQYKAYSNQKQADDMYAYSAKHETNIYGKKDADPYSQTHTTQKQDEWGQQGSHNIDSSYGKQSNQGYQQLQMQNSYGKQQSWQSGHDPLYTTTGKNSYSTNTHQGAFESKTMQPIKEDQALTHFTPPVKHEPVVKNNTEFHEPEGFASNNKINFVGRNTDSSVTMKTDGTASPITVNGFSIRPHENFTVRKGDSVEVDNVLYRMNHEQKFVPVSQDAKMVNDLFPNGINNINSRQGQIGDCAKMAQMHSMMTDPSGIATKALLDTIKRHPSGQGYQVTTGTGYTTHIRTVRDDYGNVQVLGKKPDEAQGATGDPGFQVLERAHYRQVRNERFGKDEVTYTDQNGMLQRSNTLAKRNTDLDANWSSDYATKLVGNNGNFKSFTFDGGDVPVKQMSTLEKLKLKKAQPEMTPAEWQSLQKQRWMNKTTFDDRMKDPAQRAKIEAFMKDAEQNPGNFRGVAVSRYTNGNDTVKLKLSDGREIYGNHAYSFQGVGKDINGNKMVMLSNPHDAAVPLNMSPTDFYRNFSMFDGLMRTS